MFTSNQGGKDMGTKTERIAYKRLRPGQGVRVLSDEDVVLEMRDRGRVLLFEDRIGRTHEVRRADEGWWTVSRLPCDACGTPTADRVWGAYGDHWTPMHLHADDCR